ncbi:MAG: MATE family efflux transporter [Clostridiales bacterium]|nr:MATE family efflux transporter [Clostridiales bacterium]
MTAQKTQIKDFTKGKIFKPLVLFAAPLFLSNLLQLVYNMVDMVVVGNVLGKAGTSAVSVGGDVVNFLTVVAMGFGLAVQVIIARYVGSGERKKIGAFVGTMSGFLFLCAVVVSVIGIVFQNGILSIMNTPDEAFEGAKDYSFICMIGLVFIYGYNIVSAILRGMGDSKHPFVFISIAAVLNLGLDLLLVAVFDMGTAGAALATVISQGISFIVSLIFLIKKRAQFELNVSISAFFKWNKPMLIALIKLGVPLIIRSASVHVSKLFVNSFINGYGVEVSAFSGIAHKIAYIVNQLALSVSTAGSTMVGQNIVIGRFDRVKKVMASIGVLTVSLSVVMIIAMNLFPREIFSLFTSEGDEGVLNLVDGYIPIAMLLFSATALRPITNALIMGSANNVVNFSTAILDGIVMRIGLALLFGLWLDMGFYGFWLGDALAGFTPFVIGGIFFLSGKWKTTSLGKNKKEKNLA